MLSYIFDPVLYSIEKQILQNIPYYLPDNDRLSWILYSRKVGENYQFQIYGRQELFERKLLAYLFIPPDCRTIYKHIYKYVRESQKTLLEDAIIEIARRLPQIPLIKE